MIENHLKAFKHNDYPFDFVTRVAFLEDSLEINYRISGELSKIAFEELSINPKRIIGLWKKTCLELFLRSGNPKEYIEFNFSPNGDWNCFVFNEKISELTEYNGISEIGFQSSSKTDEYKLNIKIKKSDLPKVHQDFSIAEFSTTSVLLLKNDEGRLEETFWAINHCDSKPNFHHPDSYIKK